MMTFTNKQSRALKAKLAHKHVKTRNNNGTPISYVEGWHVIAEANRIFGYDCWDRTTLAPTCVWSELQRGQTVCFYSTRVRIRVRAGSVEIVRDGIGTGSGRSSSPEQAHEIALKAAETDATKRALATFGNPFGLALYDKDQAGVGKPARQPESGAAGGQNTTPERPHALRPLLELIRAGLPTRRFNSPETYIAAVIADIRSIGSLEALYAFWESNRSTFATVREHAADRNEDPIGCVIDALKDRARHLGKNTDEMPELTDRSREPRLAIPKERRLRDKAHLTFVASLPCTVCGRRPSHAHHLRFAQPRAMAMKVSDEFTVPLCAIHHDEVHRAGDEAAWWAQRGIIEPLTVAAKLWAATRQGHADGEATEALQSLQACRVKANGSTGGMERRPGKPIE